MSEKSTPPVSRAWPRSGSWKSSSTSWPGSRAKMSGIGCSSIHRPAAATRARRSRSWGATAERAPHVPAVEREVEHVLEQLLAGGLAVAGQLGSEHVVARGEPVEERVVGQEAARAVQ